VGIQPPPLRKDDLGWKFEVLQYAIQHFPSVLPEDIKEFGGYNYDSLEWYIIAYHAV
jgi:hypothetical protein